MSQSTLLNKDAPPYQPITCHIKPPPPPTCTYRPCYYFLTQPFYKTPEEYLPSFYTCATTKISQSQLHTNLAASIQNAGGTYTTVVYTGGKKFADNKISWSKRRCHPSSKFFTGGKKCTGKYMVQWKPKVCNPAGIRDDVNTKTTVMIKNIPNQMRRNMLVDFLDKVCGSNKLEYDFLYLPMDFATCNNFGYAFVNFTSAEGAMMIMKLLQGYEWGNVETGFGDVFCSNKVCDITWAIIQGRVAQIRRYENSFFSCGTNEWLPVLFSPPRCGPSSICQERTIGRCIVSKVT